MENKKLRVLFIALACLVGSAAVNSSAFAQFQEGETISFKAHDASGLSSGTYDITRSESGTVAKVMLDYNRARDLTPVLYQIQKSDGRMLSVTPDLYSASVSILSCGVSTSAKCTLTGDDEISRICACVNSDGGHTSAAKYYTPTGKDINK